MSELEIGIEHNQSITGLFLLYRPKTAQTFPSTIHQKVLDSDIWKEEKPQTFLLFLYLILKANHKNNSFGGIVIHRGQHLTNIPTIVKGFNVSYTYNQIETSLNKLKEIGAITASKFGSRKLLINVCNYDKYQNRDRIRK